MLTIDQIKYRRKVLVSYHIVKAGVAAEGGIL